MCIIQYAKAMNHAVTLIVMCQASDNSDRWCAVNGKYRVTLQGQLC